MPFWYRLNSSQHINFCVGRSARLHLLVLLRKEEGHDILRQQENTWQQLRFHFLYELIHASVPLGACATGDA